MVGEGGYHGRAMIDTLRRVGSVLGCAAMLTGAPCAAAGGAAAPLPALERVTVLPAPKLLPDFRLTDQDGRTRTLASLRGAPLLVFFGFTHCPEICPAAMTKLKLLHESSGGALKAARVVMISVDGERDTPTVMKKYLASFSPDFIGLTGNPRSVADIAARFSAVAFKEQPDAAGNYGYFHSSQVFLVDGGGRLRATFSDASLETMAQVTGLVIREMGTGSGS